jgi:hypothetical protein
MSTTFNEVRKAITEVSVAITENVKKAQVTPSIKYIVNLAEAMTYHDRLVFLNIATDYFCKRGVFEDLTTLDEFSNNHISKVHIDALKKYEKFMQITFKELTIIHKAAFVLTNDQFHRYSKIAEKEPSKKLDKLICKIFNSMIKDMRIRNVNMNVLKKVLGYGHVFVNIEHLIITMNLKQLE